MKKVTSFTHLYTGEGHRIAYTYSELDENGNFISQMGKNELCTTVMSISFERKLPLIPGQLLEEILAYFREDLSLEAMVRIVYDKETGMFSFYKAGGVRSKVRLDYVFEAGEDMFSPSKIQVMELHSHNVMNAFFSPTDDRDESCYPGVFGVVGRLDEEEPEMLLRAGNDGMFTWLRIEDIFDLDGTSLEFLSAA